MLRVTTGLALISLALTGTARADEGKVNILYNMTIAGLPIGTAALKLKLDAGGHYDIVASAKVGGVLRLVNNGKGSASAQGRIGNGGVIAPASFALNSVSARKPQTIRMAIARGTVTDSEMTPPPVERAGRIPVTAADKKNIIDPLSAMIAVAPGKGQGGPALCRRSLPIFDGGQRFDVRLSYVRTEKVKAKGDFAGEAVVCSARYVPIAGHRPARGQTKFMVANKDLEIWLAPVSGTRLYAPWRIVVGTQVGRLVVDAASFSTGGSSDVTGSTE